MSVSEYIKAKKYAFFLDTYIVLFVRLSAALQVFCCRIISCFYKVEAPLKLIYHSLMSFGMFTQLPFKFRHQTYSTHCINAFAFKLHIRRLQR